MSWPFVAAGIVSSRSVSTRSLGRAVRRRGRRGRGDHRRGARVVDERLRDGVDAGRLLEVVAQVLQARVGRRLVGLLALVVGLLLDLLRLRVELRLDLRLRLRLRLGGRDALRLEARCGLLLLLVGLLLGLLLLVCSCWSILSSCSWSAFAGFFDRSTLTSSGPLAPTPNPPVSPSYARRASVLVGSAPLSCWPRYRSRTGSASATRTTRATSALGSGRRVTNRAHRSQPCGWSSFAVRRWRERERVDARARRSPAARAAA